MKIERLGKVLIFILVVILAVPLFVTYKNWATVKATFFQYTLSDLANLLSTMIIGLVVTVYFTIIINSSSRRLDLIIENISVFQDYYKGIISKYVRYCDKTFDQNSKDHIVRVFRLASIELSNIQVYLEYENIFSGKIKDMYHKILEQHFSFKEQVTDIPFRNDYKINESDINRTSENYYRIKQNIQKLKLCIYK